MDAPISWLQPEQEGPAAKTWLRLWQTREVTKFLSNNQDVYFWNNNNNHCAQVPVGATPTATPATLTTVPANCHFPVFPIMPTNAISGTAVTGFTGLTNASTFTNIGVNLLHTCDDVYLLATRKRKKENRASTCDLNYYCYEIHGQFGGFPWILKDACYRGVEGLHDEIEHFYRWMQPNQVEYAVRIDVIKRVEAIILALWPDAEVQVYGSFQTGLYLPTSDIDIVIIGHWTQLPFQTLHDVFKEKDFADPSTIKVLDKATVPIIKLTDKKTDIRLDISFNVSNGLKSANLIKEYKKKYPVLQKLVYVLKQFLLQRDLNEVFTGGVSSYGLILMCISFLQLHPNQAYVMQSTEKSLGVLLIQFFELYGREFNYEKVGIRITNGGSYINKEELLKDMNDVGYRPTTLYIEDPLAPDNDICRSSYAILQIRRAFDYAYNVLLSGVNTLHNDNIYGVSILNRIIRMSDDVIHYRHWLFSKFRSQVSETEVNNTQTHSERNSSLSSNCSTSSDDSNVQSECSDKISNPNKHGMNQYANGKVYSNLCQKSQKMNNLKSRKWPSSTTASNSNIAESKTVSSIAVSSPKVVLVKSEIPVVSSMSINTNNHNQLVSQNNAKINSNNNNNNNSHLIKNTNSSNLKANNVRSNQEISRRKKNKTNFTSRN